MRNTEENSYEKARLILHNTGKEQAENSYEGKSKLHPRYVNEKRICISSEAFFVLNIGDDKREHKQTSMWHTGHQWATTTGITDTTGMGRS
jgi:hypothetical protein